MSSTIRSTSSILLVSSATLSTSSSRLTQVGENTAFIGLMARSSSPTASRCCGCSTPARMAALYESSLYGSHPPKTRSSMEASGTKSLMSGLRSSVRFPRRMWPIWVRDPIGSAKPLRAARTPA